MRQTSQGLEGFPKGKRTPHQPDKLFLVESHFSLNLSPVQPSRLHLSLRGGIFENGRVQGGFLGERMGRGRRGDGVGKEKMKSYCFYQKSLGINKSRERNCERKRDGMKS